MKQYQYIFGPVLSRRLGVSLGVDLVPHKTCSMDCLYCECGKTTLLTKTRDEYVPVNAVIKELDHYLDHHSTPDYITFSGGGEPTLNTGLETVIDHIKYRAPKAQVAVLTNSAGLSDPRVVESLLKADLVVPSMDAATQTVFEKINQPVNGIKIEGIIQDLAAFVRHFNGQVWLEIVVVPGINDFQNELEAIKAAIEKIRPDRVQLNTLDRPGTCRDIGPASQEQLEQIKTFLSDPRVEIVAKAAPKRQVKAEQKDFDSAILKTLARRPCTLDDLSSMLGFGAESLQLCLDEMKKAGRIQEAVQERGVFYEIIHE